MKSVLFFLCVVAFVSVSAAFALPHEIGFSFEKGRKSNYNGNTRIDVGDAAADADFTVSCTRTGRCKSLGSGPEKTSFLMG